MIPHDPDAEVALLGSMLGDPRAAAVALETVKAADFYDPRNAAFFRILSSLYPKHPEFDPIVLRKTIVDLGLREAIGGEERIGQIIESTPACSHVESYCSVVRETAQRRRLLDAAEKIRSIAISGSGEEPLSILALDALEESSGEDIGRTPIDMQDAANPIIDEALNQPEQDHWGIPCMVAQGAIDDLTGGIQRGQFWVLGSPPSMGKSTLIVAITIGVSNAGEGKPLILSTEMRPEALARWAVASMAGIHSKALRKHNLTDNQRMAVERVRDEHPLKNIGVMYASGMSINEVRVVARAHRRRHGLPLLVVDLASGLWANGDSEQSRIANILRGLVALKSELDCCVLACAHLNRQVHSNDGRRPTLANLRDSGEWEQHADRVLFLHREAYYDGTKPTITEIIQAKDREDGNVGSCFIEWRKANGQYVRAEKPCEKKSAPAVWQTT